MSRPPATAPRPARPSLFRRWGSFVARHPWYLIAGWIAGVALIVGASFAFGGSYADEFQIPGTESQRASDLIDERFPVRGGTVARFVFYAGQGVEDPAVRATVERVLAEARQVPDVVIVQSPYEERGAISPDGTTAFATVRLPDDTEDSVRELVGIADAADGRDGVTVEIGGQAVERTEQEGLGSTELIGVAAAAVILLIAFGSIVAMGVPIVTALFSLGAALSGIGLAALVLDLSSFTPAFAAMIGLGVGIDYALLVVTRFREGIHKGASVHDAVATAVDTAGRSVVFAGTVVIIAMVSLTLVGIPFIAALGLAAAMVVALSALAGVSLLPAVLALIGRRIDSLAIPFLRTSEDRQTATVWYRLSLAIQRRPLPFVALGSGLLLLLAIPLAGIETNFTDAGNGSTALHSRRAYDLLSEGFGAGFNGPLTVVVDTSAARSEDGAAQLAQAIAGQPNVAGVSDPVVNPAGDTAILTVYPESAPQDGKTNDLVHRLRDDVIPGVTDGNGLKAYVTGGTAAMIDVSDRIRSQTPLFIASVLGLSFLVLMVVFRSLLIPLKAALMNLLSISAAYGVLVAVFQWGWFAEPLGINITGPIETFLPMMMFAILFGLSMDYEVFLVSRMHEEYEAGADNSHAVAVGLSSTARVITSAALIMIAVFGSFMLGSDRVIKEFGFGLAIAIFLDATVVRLIIVPSAMELMGKANWWLPGPLDRLIPRIDIEGGHQSAPLRVEVD